jgi:hypothetical protein
VFSSQTGASRAVDDIRLVGFAAVELTDRNA